MKTWGQNCNMCGVGVGGVRGKNCHTLSGCSSLKGQDCRGQEAWSQLAGLLASASLLMRDSDFFVLASELFSESDHFFL